MLMTIARLAVVLLIPVVLSVPPRAQTRAVVLDGVRVIDGTGGAPLEAGRVVISGGRIAAVGVARSTAIPDGAEVVDLAGHTVIPGLIDSHFHIEDDPKMAL